VDAIFSGVVRNITVIPEDGPPLRPNEARLPRAFRVDFDVIDTFRGIEGSMASVLTSGSGPSCGYGFTQGERYLVYAHKGRDGGFVTGICSRTRKLSEAREDLEFLNALAAQAAPPARIFGTVKHWERDLSTGQPQAHGPVPDVRISAQGATNTFDARSNARGEYELALPPGKYQITASPPAGFSQTSLTQNAELPGPGACFVVDFGLQFDGRIGGVMHDSSGKPAANVAVQIISADDAGKVGLIWDRSVVTDANGRFEFVDTSPGRYLVGVDLTRRASRPVVFPTRYHPGTADPALATVVELRGGEHRELPPMTVPAPRREYQIAGIIAFADGRPAQGASISLMNGNSQRLQVAFGTRVGPDGTFSFAVHEGLSYVALATCWDESERQQLQGRAGPFVITGNLTNVRVTLSETTYRAR
jgi:5-hydroxyisourate hydrolase-like protein (transthyretin family)